MVLWQFEIATNVEYYQFSKHLTNYMHRLRGYLVPNVHVQK